MEQCNFEVDDKGDPLPFDDSVQFVQEPTGETLDEYPGAASALVEWGVRAIWLDPPPARRKDRAWLVDKGPPIDVKPPWGNSPADPYEVPMIFEDNDENLTKVAAQF